MGACGNEIPQMTPNVRAQWFINVHFFESHASYNSAVSCPSDADPAMDSLRVEFTAISGYCCERMDSARIYLDVSCDNRERETDK
jgi:hypothetical protein